MATSDTTMTETLTAYVPAFVGRRLAEDPSSIPVPSSHQAEGVCLFVDIAGFTPLTEELARHGAVGAEEMAGILNDIFGPLLATCATHGGEVVDFAGDAIFVIWWADDRALDETAMQATQCAMVLQNLVGAGIDADGRNISVRITVTAGPLDILYLGGVEGRKHSTVVGAPVQRLADLEQDAIPGSVVVDPGVATLLTGGYEGETTGAGVTIWRLNSSVPVVPVDLPVIPEAADSGLREFVPDVIPLRLEAGQDEWLAEFRRVTSVFVNLFGLRLYESSGFDELHDVVAGIQGIVQHYEGVIHKVMDGDKGLAILATFGLPPHSHEDDAERGVLAAVEIEDAVAGRGLRSGIGISTGRVFAGPIGDAVRRDYTVIGDAVNVAARLMQAAPDDILCDESTARSFTGMSYEAIEPMVVKGKSEPVRLFRPEGGTQFSVGDASGSTPMVGRQEERDILDGVLERLGTDEGGAVVLVEGEPGIGKTRLLQDFAGRAATEGFRIFTGAGSAIETSTPYLVWRTVLTDILDLGDVADDPGSRRRHVLRWFRSRSLPLEDAPLLNDVMAIELPESSAGPTLTDALRAKAVRRLIVDVVAAGVGERPAVFILEDGHHFDSASWALVQAVHDRIPNVAMAIGLRDMERSGDPVAAATITIHLEKLDVEDTFALVEHRLGVEALPVSVREVIAGRAAGHPLFSEELAIALRDTGVIVVENGECRLTSSVSELKELAIPETVQGVVTSRIDRMTPAAQLLIKIASVLGATFNERLLLEIHPTESDPADLHRTVLELEERSFVMPNGTDEASYIFKHAVIRDVAYEALPYAQRRRLHRAVAISLESTAQDRTVHDAPLLGHHWFEAAGDGSDDEEALHRAEKYLKEAGRTALRQGAFTEAERHLRDALSCFERLGDEGRDPIRELGILQPLSTATFATNGYGSSATRAIAERAFETADGVVGGRDLFPILWSLWITTHFSDATDRALELGDRLLAIADQEDDDELALQAHHALWTTLIQVPVYPRAMEHLDEGARLYRPEWHERHCAEFGGHDPGSCAQRALALTQWATGFPDTAVAAGEEAVVLAQDHAFSAMSARLALAFVHRERGDLDATAHEAEALIDLARERDLPANIDWASILVAWADGRRGDADAAIAEITGIADRLGMKDPGYLAMLVDLLLIDGRIDEGLALVDDLLNVVEEKDHRQYEAELHRLRGELLFARDPDGTDRAEAEEAMQRAITVAAVQGALSYELRACMSLARLHAGTDLADQAIRNLQGTLDRFEEGFSTADLEAAAAMLSATSTE